MMKKIIYITIRFILFFFFIFVLSQEVNAETINLNFNPYSSYGKANVYYGIKLSSSFDDFLVQDLINTMSNKNVYLKMVDPSPNIINDYNFQRLKNSGFRFYFTFTSNDKALFFLNSFNQPLNDTVIELVNYSPSFINSIKNQFPQIKIHTSQLLFWPRDRVKNILDQTGPSVIEAVSFYTENENFKPTLFETVKLMFDTFFDACSDIPGTSGIKINYPQNIQLSLSDIRVTGNSEKAVSYIAGVISSALVATVQVQNRLGKAPIKYVIAGDYLRHNEVGKMILAGIADFVFNNPDIIWPLAHPSNGEPFDVGNNKKIVGVIGYKSEKYYMILTNTINENVTVNFSQSINADVNQIYSTKRGKNFIIGNFNKIVFLPYEVIIMSLKFPDLSFSSQIAQYPTPTEVITSYQINQNKVTPLINNTPTVLPVNIQSLKPITSKPELFLHQPTKSLDVKSDNKNSPVLEFLNRRLTYDKNLSFADKDSKKNINNLIFVHFKIKIINPYDPYRQINKTVLTIDNKDYLIDGYEKDLFFELTNKPSKYQLKITTSDNFNFIKEGQINFDKVNKIDIVLANPVVIKLKEASILLFNLLEQINNFLTLLDKPFRDKNF